MRANPFIHNFYTYWRKRSKKLTNRLHKKQDVEELLRKRIVLFVNDLNEQIMYTRLYAFPASSLHLHF